MSDVSWVRQQDGHLRGYCSAGVLLVWKSIITAGYRWEVENGPPPDPCGGICATEEQAVQAIEAAVKELL